MAMESLPKSAVLVPLYIYPNPGSWDRLYSAIATNPALDFIIVINPNSGPGSPPWWPNEDYVREIPRLNRYENVKVLGYVRTTWCNRAIADVMADIDTYASWSHEHVTSECMISGVFFDETPNLYSEEAKQYLSEISRYVKTRIGIIGDKMVIHNPGTAVEAGLSDHGSDITVITENSYAASNTSEYQKWMSTSKYGRDQSAMVVHSVPEDNVAELTKQLRERAAFLFLTELSTSYYQSLGPSWETFVEHMSRE